MSNSSNKRNQILTSIQLKLDGEFLFKIITIVLVTILIVALISFISNAQNTLPSSGNVGIGTMAPSSSAALDMTITTKGVLVPRLTKAQRFAIASPAIQ